MMRLEKIFVIPAVVAIALATGACAERHLDRWENSQRFEGPGFGDNHRQVMAKHIVNPEPVKPTDAQSAVEAERLSVGMGKYMKDAIEGAGAVSGGSTGSQIR
jgi:type IV pilus biogenesis protein CpaD/CtpE